MNELAEEIRTLHDIQGMDGNWDHSSYMLGVYNGLELVMSIIESRDPVYRNVPATFGENVTKEVPPELDIQNV